MDCLTKLAGSISKMGARQCPCMRLRALRCSFFAALQSISSAKQPAEARRSLVHRAGVRADQHRPGLGGHRPGRGMAGHRRRAHRPTGGCCAARACPSWSGTPPPASTRASTPTCEVLDPAEATVVADDSPHYRRSRLWLEATLRKTAVPLDGTAPHGQRRHAGRPARLPAGGRAQGPRPGQPPHPHPAGRRGRARQDARDRHDPVRADQARPRRADPDRHAPARARADAERDVVAVRDPVRPARLARHPAGPPEAARHPEPVQLLQARHHLDRHAQEQAVPGPPAQAELGRGRHRRVPQRDQLRAR